MRRVTQHEAERVAGLFLKGRLIRPIGLTVESLAIAVDEVDEPDWDAVWEMESREMTGPGGQKPISVNGRFGRLRLMVGRWSDQPDNQQVVFSSTRKELDPRFGQINLNLSLTDDRTVYLVKNLSKDGGSGAIKRLFGGAGGPEMLHERERRRWELARNLGNETLDFEEDRWLVVAALPLHPPQRRVDSLFSEVLVQIFRYAAQVERLRHGATLDDDEAEVAADNLSRGGAPVRLSAVERKRIELEAMAFVRSHLEREGYRVIDVASRESYDFEAHRGGETLFVEVKGTTTRPWSVELTAPEHRVAVREGDRYSMYVVVFEDVDRVDDPDVIQVGNPVTSRSYTVEPVRFRVRER